VTERNPYWTSKGQAHFIPELVRDMIVGSNLKSPILIDAHARTISSDEGAKF
jgi:hypothetical protein